MRARGYQITIKQAPLVSSRRETSRRAACDHILSAAHRTPNGWAVARVRKELARILETLKEEHDERHWFVDPSTGNTFGFDLVGQS